MGGVIVLEVLDRRGHVQARIRLDALPVTVGRGYGNDVILDDRYVSPEHFRMTRDATGDVVVEDLGSTNGLYDAASGERVSRVTVRPGLRLRAGRTVVRFGFADQPVPPAVPDPPLTGVGRALASRRTVLGACIVAPLLVGWQSYLDSYGRVSFAESVSSALGALVVLALWAGAWAFASRVLVHRPQFLAHLAVASAALVTVMLLGTATSYVGFLHPSAAWLSGVETAGTVGLGAAALYGHLTLASTMPERRAGVVALLIAVALAGIAQLADADHDESVDTLDFSGALEPLGVGWLRPTSMDDFLREADRLQARTDSLAAKRPARGS